MKTIFITGGRGFIGRNLSEALEKQGYRILVPSSTELNLLDEKAVDAFIEKQHIDVIVHGANKGGGRDTMDMKDVIHTNLRMFFNIVKHADKVEKIIQFGSGAEYGKHKPIVMVSEEEAVNAMPLDDYGFYKSVCSRYIEHSASNIINLRIFACYGKYEDYRYKFISNAIVKNLLGMPINIRQNVIFDYIYVEDLIKMVLWAVTSETIHKAYNITRGVGVELATLAGIVNMVAKNKSEIIIDSPGMNVAYTSSNQRIMDECSFDFHSHEEAIGCLYDYYAQNLGRLDLAAVKGDEFINKIIVRK